MEKISVIIMAAGKGTRMKSEKAKVLHEVGGRPMLLHVLDTATGMGAERTVVIVGHQAGKVMEAFPDRGLIFAEQKEQLGTGHAVMQAEEALTGFNGNILILSGDVPLITTDTLRDLCFMHQTEKAAITVLTAQLHNPYGYGRVIKDEAGRIRKIVEEKDASAEERMVREINTGIYCVDSGFLFKALKGLTPKNAQKEYYLTDIVGMAVQEGKVAATSIASDFKEVMGINSRIDLAEAESHMKIRIMARLMSEGVTIIDPSATYISGSATIGKDTVIYPGVVINGTTEIGPCSSISTGCVITNSRIGGGVKMKPYCIVEESEIMDGAIIGPMAHLRPQSSIGKGAHIGNFVEIKKASIGDGSKANHLSYIGDATVGKGVNIGAGTITCNYDGVKKHQTVIEDDVFVGSDSQFVAPVRIGKGSLVGAGSTITEDIPEDSIALSRVKQEVRKGAAGKYWQTKGKKP